MEKELQNKNDREPQFSEFFDELKMILMPEI